LSVDTSRIRSTYRTGLQMAAKATHRRALSLLGYLLWATLRPSESVLAGQI